MGRVLFFVVIGAMVALGFYTTRMQRIKKERQELERRRREREKRLESEPMVRCAHCGLHVPRSEALPREGHYYCCEEHRELGPK